MTCPLDEARALQLAPHKGAGVVGRVHAVETGGGVDGPGLRWVLFLQGCPLRCLYCHNPDTRAREGGQARTVDELVDEVRSYASYLRASGGGVTVSGGEPFLQPEFLEAFFRRVKDEGIHTAVDTSGMVALPVATRVLPHVDLVLLDIKAADEEAHKRVTGTPLSPVLRFADYLAQIGKPVWLRFVLVPGLTDDQVEGVARLIEPMKNIERVEVLPFHKLGESKWKALKLPYTLADTPSPSPALVERARDVFRRHGHFAC